MDKPVIFAIDDEPSVLSAVARDLRRRYGQAYEVARAGSGADALEAMKELRLANRAIALIVADQRMPQMTGVELLRQTLELFPDAKRVLLTAYADTDAAIKAINEVHLDHYLMKPWDPPEELLYPVLDDLLDDWRAHFQPSFEGIRIVGHRWSADGHRVRDFLARNLIPYRWLDIEADPEAIRLRQLAGMDLPLPLIIMPDGTAHARPTIGELAERIGLHTHAIAETYDLIVVGTGPAGLASAVYGASEGLKTVLVEREAPGGQAGTSSRIENYLGFPVGLSGADLTRRAVAQARRFGAEILSPLEATKLETRDGYHIVTLGDGTKIASQALIVATGVSYRLLDIPGADRLSGAGLFYGAATSEAIGVTGEDVFVIGGGNSAGQAALYLARYAKSVTIMVRGKGLAESMSQYLIERIDEAPNVSVRSGASLAELHGDEALEAASVRNTATGEITREPVRAIFVFIGAEPRTQWIAGNVQLDEQGYILAGNDLAREPGRKPAGWTMEREPYWLETSVPGVFVAGDVRHRSTKRIASAVGEGAMAVQFVHQHLSGPAPAHRPEPMPPAAPANA